MAFSLRPRNRQNIEVNCGNKIIYTFLGMDGAGSYLAYELSQIASLSNKTTEMIFIDSESVKKEDVETSKYIVSDIGLNKADVTADRCSASFDIDIETSNKTIRFKEDILNLFKGRMGYFPVIICNSIDERTLSCLKEALRYISDAVIVTGIQDGVIGEVNITYKSNGDYVTTNYLETYNCSKSNIKNKAMNLELSRNMFLYLDDILCERSFSVEKTVFNLNEKKAISRYIGESDISFDLDDCEEGIKIDTKDDILCIVVGVGGTGASVAYEVAHLASVSSKNIKLVFIDGDIVENKNLNRQRFIVLDLNKYKAEVTGDRCRKSYGANIEYKNEYITCNEDIYSIIREHKGYTPIILGCSDSLRLRYLICDAVKHIKEVEDIPNDIIYIDAGNDMDSGQVICTYVKDGKYITPDFFDEFPKDLEDVNKAKLVTQLSCDELMDSAPQTKGANISAATCIYSYIHDIVQENPIKRYMSQFNNKNRKIDSKKISTRGF